MKETLLCQEHLMNFLLWVFCIDQYHEQLKKLVKEDDLTEDEDRLKKWMVCGPEVRRILMEKLNLKN